MSKRILALFPPGDMSQTITNYLEKTEWVVTEVTTAAEAIDRVDDCDAVVMELSLSNHSGFEFLYEMRSYADLRGIPVIIYSRIRLQEAVLRSRSFKMLHARYAYQPERSLADMKELLEKELGA